MGIVLDRNGSYAVTKTPNTNPGVEPILNTATIFSHRTEVRLAYQFKDSPNLGAPAPLSGRDYFQIGLIQNVLFEKIFFQYDGQPPIAKEWVTRVVDSAGDSFPFYGDGDRVLLPSGKQSENTTPFREFFYGPKGFGQVSNPFGGSADDIDLENKGSVNMIDEPMVQVPFRKDGDSLRVAEHILAFGLWLVLVDTGRKSPTVAVGHLGPFTVLSRTEFELVDGLSAFSTPDYRFFFHAQNGIAKRLNKAIADRGGSTSLTPQQGGKLPLMTGETANTRGLQWMQSVGLAP
jgi:hypothetical protein